MAPECWSTACVWWIGYIIITVKLLHGAGSWNREANRSFCSGESAPSPPWAFLTILNGVLFVG